MSTNEYIHNQYIKFIHAHTCWTNGIFQVHDADSKGLKNTSYNLKLLFRSQLINFLNKTIHKDTFILIKIGLKKESVLSLKEQQQQHNIVFSFI